MIKVNIILVRNHNNSEDIMEFIVLFFPLYSFKIDMLSMFIIRLRYQWMILEVSQTYMCLK